MAADTLLMRQGVFRRNVMLQFLREYSRDHQVMPSRREIGNAVGLRSLRQVQHHLLRMERDGSISLDRWLARSIRLLEASYV